MSDLVTRATPATIVPAPLHPIAIRVATMADLPFMDALQKANSKALGYFPTKQFEGYIEMGGVLVAWASSPCSSGEMQDTGRMPVPQPLGYVISRDRYLKRDELGVIYQLCVAPGASARADRRESHQSGVRAQRVRVQALLLLVCAGPRRELLLGEPGVRAARLPRRQWAQAQDSHLLATAD